MALEHLGTCSSVWKLFLVNLINFILAGKPSSSSSMIDLERKGNNKQERKCKSRPSKYEKPSNRSSTDNSKSRGTAQCFLYGQTDSQLQPDSVTSIGGRDLALFLFRALGKILYCKSKYSFFVAHCILATNYYAVLLSEWVSVTKESGPAMNSPNFDLMFPNLWNYLGDFGDFTEMLLSYIFGPRVVKISTIFKVITSAVSYMQV